MTLWLMYFHTSKKLFIFTVTATYSLVLPNVNMFPALSSPPSHTPSSPYLLRLSVIVKITKIGSAASESHLSIIFDLSYFDHMKGKKKQHNV